MQNYNLPILDNTLKESLTMFNNAFDSLRSCFAGNEVPPNPIKGQLWLDESNNQLKIFDGSAWQYLNLFITHNHDDRYYTKTEISDLLDNYYTKTETEDTFYDKIEIDDNFYNKTEISDLLDNYYTKTEVDTKDFKVYNYQLTSADITNKYFLLPSIPEQPDNTIFLVRHSGTQIYNIDFIIDSDKLSWDGYGLDDDATLDIGTYVTVLYR